MPADRDTVNGWELPKSGKNLDIGSSDDLDGVVSFCRTARSVIDTDGAIDGAAFAGDLIVTDSTAAALAVGANGATNPVLLVDAATSSVATGIEVTGAAATAGVAITAISSGTNEDMTIDAKGSGTITIAGTSTGEVTITPATNITGALDVTGDTNVASVKTDANVGAVNTGVTAVEYGDGSYHKTVLTVSQADALTIADNSALADGYLLYTLPAGAVVVHAAYMSMAITAASTEAKTDTPDVGLGTLLASDTQATLDADDAACENILTGQTANDCNGTAEVKTVSNQILTIESGDAHTVYFNAADTWADDTGGDLTADIAGTVVLVWSFIA